MARAEHEPLTGVWGGAPSGVQADPLVRGLGNDRLKPFSFSTSNESGNIYPIDCVWQTECLWCPYYIEQKFQMLPYWGLKAAEGDGDGFQGNTQKYHRHTYGESSAFREFNTVLYDIFVRVFF